MKISRSAYYSSLKKDDEPHSSESASQVREVFYRHSRRYGSRRIQAEMKAEGHCVGRHKIRRLMRDQGLRAIQPKRFVPRTTDSRHGKRMSANLLLGRDMPPSKPNEVIVGDITYLPLASGGWADQRQLEFLSVSPHVKILLSIGHRLILAISSEREKASLSPLLTISAEARSDVKDRGHRPRPLSLRGGLSLTSPAAEATRLLLTNLSYLGVVCCDTNFIGGVQDATRSGKSIVFEKLSLIQS